MCKKIRKHIHLNAGASGITTEKARQKFKWLLASLLVNTLKRIDNCVLTCKNQ